MRKSGPPRPRRGEAAAGQTDARRLPRQLSGPVPGLAPVGRWKWALARGAAPRIHIAANCDDKFSFPCLRKGSVLHESGTTPEDALDIASGLCRKFCGKSETKSMDAAKPFCEQFARNQVITKLRG